MKSYTIIKSGPRPDWALVEALALQACRWSPNPPPAAEVKVVWTEEALLVRLESYAAPTRAENTAPDSPVWEDNCLEFFFAAAGTDYLNLEANAKGALRASIGPDRHARRLLRALAVPLPAVTAECSGSGWSVLFTIPAALLETLLGVTPHSGLRLRGNFYTCGDRTPAPYYAAWNTVETPAPDFHRPEFFGELLLQ